MRHCSCVVGQPTATRECLRGYSHHPVYSYAMPIQAKLATRMKKARNGMCAGWLE
jgi:hypothetical protein